VSQNSESNHKACILSCTNNYLPSIISLDIFLQTRILFLHVYLQTVYYNCVKFYKYWYLRFTVYKELRLLEILTERQGEFYISPSFFEWGILKLKLRLTHLNTLWSQLIGDTDWGGWFNVDLLLLAYQYTSVEV